MKSILRFLFLICITACKEKYNPEIHLPSSGLLVVEGFINYYFGSGYGVPIMPYEQYAFILGASAACVDCRVKGGTTLKPDFWH